MKFYTTSLELEDKNENVIFVDIDNYKNIEDEDIVLTTGTFRDELNLKMLLDRGIIPTIFMIKIPKDDGMNSFVKDMSLTLYREDHSLDNDFLDKCKTISEQLAIYYEATVAQEKEDEKQEAIELFELYAHYTILSNISTYRAETRDSSPDFRHKELINYILQETRKGNLYLFLLKNQKLKVFHIENRTISKEDIRDNIEFDLETIYKGEYNVEAELQKLQLKDITMEYNKTFTLFYVSEPDDNYFVKDIKPLVVTLTNDGELEYTSKDIKMIFSYRLLDVGQKNVDNMRKALKALKIVLEKCDEPDKQDIIHNIKYFLKYTNNAKRLINNLSQEEKEYFFNRTIDDNRVDIRFSSHFDNMMCLESDMHIKMYEKYKRIKKPDPDIDIDFRKVTNIDFSLITLTEKNIEELDDNMINSLFLDIKNGIGLKQMAANYYNKFIKNNTFKNYLQTIEEAENIIDSTEEDCQDLSDMAEELMEYEKVTNSKYIDLLMRYIGKDSKLYGRLEKIYELSQIDDSKPFDEETYDVYDIDKESKDSERRLGIEDIVLFIRTIMRTIMNFKSPYKINIQKITKLVGSILIDLTIDYDKNNNKQQYACCFFFILEKAKYDATMLLDHFEMYIKNELSNNKLKPIDYYLQKNMCEFSCSKDDRATILKTGGKEYKNKALTDSVKSYKDKELKKFYNFFMIFSESDRSQISSLCNDDNTILFFTLLIRSNQKTIRENNHCPKLLENFFNSFNNSNNSFST